MTNTNARVLVVASHNRVKLSAARNAFAQVFMPELGGFFNQTKQWIKDIVDPEDVKVIRADVASLVSSQPTTSKETELGARNRLAAIKKMYPDAEAWAAIEGGVVITEKSVIEIGVVIVSHKDCPQDFLVEAPRFTVAYQTDVRIRAGMEMGPANDQAFGLTNSKQDGGMAGIITDQLVTRYDLYYTPLLIAFSQAKNYHLFKP